MTRKVGVCRTVMLAAIIIIFAGLSAQPSTASVVAVGTCVANVVHFATIQGAVDAVPPGSTIKICPANYPEQVVTNKNLTLTGVSSGSADNPVLVIPSGGFVPNTASLTSGHPIAAQILVKSPATAVTISSLTVDGSNNNLNGGCNDARLIGIYYQNASGTGNFVAARNQARDAANFGCQTSAGLGIYLQSVSPSTSTVKLQNTTVRGYQKNGITGNEVGTTVTITGNSVVGAGPTTTAQNGIQVGFGATGKVQNNTVADDDFNGDPSAGTGSGILIYDSGNNNTVSGNTVFSSGQAGIHLDSSCGSTGNNNTVSKNTVNEACAGILHGGGTGNTFPMATVVANVANTSLAGDVCAPAVLTLSRVNSQGHSSSPARP